MFCALIAGDKHVLQADDSKQLTNMYLISIKAVALSFLLLVLSGTPKDCKLRSLQKQFPPAISWVNGKPPLNPYRYNNALVFRNSVFVVGGDNKGAFEAYEISSAKWRMLSPLPAPKSFAGAAILDSFLYVIGGIDTLGNYSPEVQKYNILKNKWTRCNPLKSPRSRFALVNLNGKLYAIGGLAGGNDRTAENSDLVEVYTPAADKWSTGPALLTPRHGLSAVNFGNKILAMGGYTNSGKVPNVEEFDPITQKWTVRSPMPTPRGFFGLAATKDFVYAIAGRLQNAPVERYDPEADLWRTLDPLHNPRNRFGMAAKDNKIYLIGGEGSETSMIIGTIQ
jgi:hypothetical protein